MILYFSCFVCGGAHLAASPPDAASGLRPQYTSHNYTVICDMTQGAKLVWCSCRRQPVNQLRGGGEVYKPPSRCLSRKASCRRMASNKLMHRIRNPAIFVKPVIRIRQRELFVNYKLNPPININTSPSESLNNMLNLAKILDICKNNTV